MGAGWASLTPAKPAKPAKSTKATKLTKPLSAAARAKVERAASFAAAVAAAAGRPELARIKLTDEQRKRAERAAAFAYAASISEGESRAAPPEEKPRKRRGRVADLEAEIERLASELQAERDRAARIEAEAEAERELRRQERERAAEDSRAAARFAAEAEAALQAEVEAERVRAEAELARPRAKPKREYYRDDRGSFISQADYVALQKRKAEDAELARLEKEDELRRKRDHSVELEKYRQLERLFDRIAKAMRKATPGITAMVSSEVMGAAVDGMIEVGEFFDPSAEVESNQRKGMDVLSAAIEAALKILRRKGAGKGLIFRVTLVPTDNILQIYKRDQDFMSTRWLRSFVPEDLESMYARAKNLAQALFDNNWDLTKFQLKFRYDNEVAKAVDAGDAARKKASKKEGRK